MTYKYTIPHAMVLEYQHEKSPAAVARRNALREHWVKTIDADSLPHVIDRICHAHIDSGDLDGETEPEVA
jgi:hypothetical protein